MQDFLKCKMKIVYKQWCDAGLWPVSSYCVKGHHSFEIKINEKTFNAQKNGVSHTNGKFANSK